MLILHKIGFRRNLSNIVLLICLASCSKAVDVPAPVNTITTSETFSSDATATSAIMGIYNDLVTGNAGGGYDLSFGNGMITINGGMSADELHVFGGSSAFETNTLTTTNFPGGKLWNGPYFDIYMANAAIEGLQASKGITAATRKQLIGEAKFIRAFCYFYLVNLFGDVPLALTSSYTTNNTLPRAPKDQVYDQIISDLLEASKVLADDYGISDGERTRVNKYGALALLARAYLYTEKWEKADSAASAVIGNDQFQLQPDLNAVFLVHSTEAILQWQLLPTVSPYATIEGYLTLPFSPSDPPGYFLTDELLTNFDSSDNRKDAWVDSTYYSGTWYYYPKKYKISIGDGNTISEYPMVLRLAEQYLIRSEARAHLNNLEGSINDLNVIRARAGLSNLTSSLSPSELLSAVMQERRVELFAEWAHRWLDLKRTGTADDVLSAVKPTWTTTAILYPIPSSELDNDASLTQNPGY